MSGPGVAAMVAELEAGLPNDFSSWTTVHIDQARALADAILRHADIATHYLTHPEDVPA